MHRIERMLLENKAWAKAHTETDPEYFKKMANDQKPDFLWIGCSDSRVPPSEITNTDPGEMFVHRNIANLVVHTDMNLLSVMQYAVEALKVPHIIVCGHYNCGGVKAALSQQSLGLLDHWIRNIKDTYFGNKLEIDNIQDEKARVNKLVELNVMKQVKHLAYTSVIQKSWKNAKSPHIHGWVYDIENGRLKELVTVAPDASLDPAFTYKF